PSARPAPPRCNPPLPASKNAAFPAPPTARPRKRVRSVAHQSDWFLPAVPPAFRLREPCAVPASSADVLRGRRARIHPCIPLPLFARESLLPSVQAPRNLLSRAPRFVPLRAVAAGNLGVPPQSASPPRTGCSTHVPVRPKASRAPPAFPFVARLL